MRAERYAWDEEWFKRNMHPLNVERDEVPPITVPSTFIEDQEVDQYNEWRPIWRVDNPNASMRAERDAWDDEWQKRKEKHEEEVKASSGPEASDSSAVHWAMRIFDHSSPLTPYPDFENA